MAGALQLCAAYLLDYFMVGYRLGGVALMDVPGPKGL